MQRIATLPKPPGFAPRPEGSPHYRRWPPFFLISRAIVDRGQLLALTPEDAEDAAALRLCHADEKLRLIRAIIINICGDRRQEAAHISLRSGGVSVSRSNHDQALISAPRPVAQRGAHLPRYFGSACRVLVHCSWFRLGSVAPARQSGPGWRQEDTMRFVLLVRCLTLSA